MKLADTKESKYAHSDTGREGSSIGRNPRWLCLSTQGSNRGVWHERHKQIYECEWLLNILTEITDPVPQGTRHAEFIAIAEMLQSHPRSALQSTDLYVTVEPCVMCASALKQYRIRSVYFGCANDRFGGTGGVLSLHSELVPYFLFFIFYFCFYIF